MVNQPTRLEQIFRISCLLFCAAFSNTSFSQTGVAINTTGAVADKSAMLDVSSTTTGMLVPRMTLGQRDLIVSPVNGLLIYQTNGVQGFYYYDGGSWARLSSATTVLGQSATTVYGTGPLNISSSNSTPQLVPSLQIALSVPTDGTYYAYISTDGGITTQGEGSSGFSLCDIRIEIDGHSLPAGGYRRIAAANTDGFIGNYSFWSMALAMQLSAGPHTVGVYANYSGGSSFIVGGSTSSTMQPQLTVLLIKQ